MKFGRVKREHGRVKGLDELLDRILRDGPEVRRIVPGPIKTRRGKTNPHFKVQYETATGLKCLFISTGTVQEVFIVCESAARLKNWLKNTGITDRDD